MFTLSISCLTTSNLPWFMNLTIQVPMQYCSLQHRTLPPSPVTSRTGCCFCFGSVSSFFLELFLHWSPVAYWVPTNLGKSSFRIWNSSTGIPSPPLATKLLFVVMLSKTHLTSHSRMSGSRRVMIPSWLSGSWSSFSYSSRVYSCYLFLISSQARSDAVKSNIA